MFSRPLRGGGVIAMPDSGLVSMQCGRVPPGPTLPQLLVPGVAVGVFINPHCVPDWVAVRC